MLSVYGWALPSHVCRNSDLVKSYSLNTFNLVVCSNCRTQINETYYFTPKNFQMLLKATGFKPVFFRKLDYPIDKLDVSGFEKEVVRILYALGNAINMNTQFMFIANKERNN